MTDLTSPPFSLTTEAVPGAVRLRLAGDLDHDTSEQLVERARACLAADPGVRDLVLDCAQLRLCDSMGVSSLLMIHRATTSRGVGLHLVDQPAFLRRILEITGIRQIFGPRGPGRLAGQAHVEDGPPSAPSG
ncbi:STAS domain-containing protein [Streptomyces sp. NPDC006516]|uniref:STAS domain-containing protein n=1 Tax=Streptomyces sp. NPDC006516 TaxID=3154309 RepID=UPI0033B8C212